MGDLLSQSEIDELLKALTSGTPGDLLIAESNPQKVAKDYDFNNPSMFNKEQLKTLENIFNNFSRLASSFLTGYLRAPAQLEVAQAEQRTYREFNNSLINPAILCIMDFSPLKGSVILDISSNVGYSVIDRILGGPGMGLKKLRDFSEIEKILLERFVAQMLTFLAEPWENVIELQPRLDKIETNSQFAQIISPNETCVIVTLSVKIGSAEGLMNFCIPYLVLKPVMDRLYTKYWFTLDESEDAKDYRSDIEDQLEKAAVPIRVIVGQTNITVNDFVNLQEGDIIPLDSFINSDLNVMVGNLLKFQGKPGIKRNKNAVQITSLILKED